jgi:hypothetical protein
MTTMDGKSCNSLCGSLGHLTATSVDKVVRSRQAREARIAWIALDELLAGRRGSLRSGDASNSGPEGTPLAHPLSFHRLHQSQGSSVPPPLASPFTVCRVWTSFVESLFLGSL